MHISDIVAWCNISFSGYASNPLSYAHNLYLNGELINELKIPDGVTSIGQGAFWGYNGLASVEIPNSVMHINDAFSYCSGLTSITIDNGVKSIDYDAFCGCNGLTNITIPDNVTVIHSRSFRGCSGLTSVTFGNSVTSIEEDAFRDCIGLKNITIPNSLTSIGERAFRNCSNLTSVIIGNSVTSIEEDVSYGCKSLTNVVIGNSVKSIEKSVFRECNELETIYMLGETPPTVYENNFAVAHYRNVMVYVPTGTLKKYQFADVWENFWNIQEYDPTTIENVVDDAPVFEITAGGIQFTAAEGKTITIYSTSGALVEKIDCYDGEEIMLDRGVYIVRVGGKAVKVKL